MALPGFRNHPKFRRLVALLHLPEAHVLGHVEMMWEVCYESGNAVLGDSWDVELAAGWTGEQGELTRALLACGGTTRSGLIEETEPGSEVYQVHDLLDHAPEYVDGRKRRMEERLRDKACECCGTVFRSSDPKSKFCSDACRKADWRDRHRDAEGTDKGRSATNCDAAETDAGRTETNRPTTTRPAQPSPEYKESTELVSQARPRPPRMPSWGKAHTPEVIEAALEVVQAWPHHDVDFQPTDPREPPQKVPHTKAPLLAERFAQIKREGGDLAICKAIARRAVIEWRAGSWIKAAQHFFGKEGPWKAYYQAHITNQAQAPPDSPPAEEAS